MHCLRSGSAIRALRPATQCTAFDCVVHGMLLMFALPSIIVVHGGVQCTAFSFSRCTARSLHCPLHAPRAGHCPAQSRRWVRGALPPGFAVLRCAPMHGPRPVVRAAATCGPAEALVRCCARAPASFLEGALALVAPDIMLLNILIYHNGY